MFNTTTRLVNISYNKNNGLDIITPQLIIVFLLLCFLIYVVIWMCFLVGLKNCVNGSGNEEPEIDTEQERGVFSNNLGLIGL